MWKKKSKNTLYLVSLVLIFSASVSSFAASTWPHSDGPGSKYTGGYIVDYGDCSIGADYYFPGAKGVHFYSEVMHKTVHAGLDIYLPIGYPVVAVAPGKVSRIYRVNKSTGVSRNEGNGIYIRHRSFITHSVHLDSIAPEIKIGKKVKRGEIIGFSGSTGAVNKDAPHLHLGVLSLRNDVINVHDLWYRTKEEKEKDRWHISVPEYDPNITYKKSQMTFPIDCSNFLEKSKPLRAKMKAERKAAKGNTIYKVIDADVMRKEMECAWDKTKCDD